MEPYEHEKHVFLQLCTQFYCDYFVAGAGGGYSGGGGYDNTPSYNIGIIFEIEPALSSKTT